MTNEDVIKDFLLTAKAIYKVCQLESDDEDFESITLLATDNDGGIIEINIKYKK